MWRRLFNNFIAVTSLLILAAVLAFWIRGSRVCDAWAWVAGEHTFVIDGRRSGFRLIVARRDAAAISEWAQRDTALDSRMDLPHALLLCGSRLAYERSAPKPLNHLWDDTRPRRSFFGFSYGFVPASAGSHLAHEWTNPYFVLVLVAGIVVARRCRSLYASIVRHRRSRRGLCPSCGYDVRATPDRCPECGAPSAVAPKTAA